MSLTESLLLDPYPFEIWIAARTDRQKGSGTLNEPFDGSTAAKFDARMSELTAAAVVHLDREHLKPLAIATVQPPPGK